MASVSVVSTNVDAKLMQEQHGVPRVARESDGSEERKNIDEYRALLDQVTTKVRVANREKGVCIKS
jgi:hypothetical protein